MMLYDLHGESGGGAAGLCSTRSAADAGRDLAATGGERSRGRAPSRRASPVGQSLGTPTPGERPSESQVPGARGTQAQTHGGAVAADRTGAPAGTRSTRVRHEAVDRVAGREADRGDLRRALSPEPRLAPPQAAWLELPAADGPRTRTRRGSDPSLEARALAGGKKNAAAHGQTIVFVDESGLTERPHRCRTWAPRGQTPVLQYHFNWNLLSAIAGITWWNFYFRLFPGPIKGPQVVEFLAHLRRHLRRGKLLVIWDGLPAHRSRVVRDYVAAQRGRIVLRIFRATPPSSIRSSTCGATGSITNCRTCARRRSASSASMHVRHSVACAVARRSSLHSGSRRNCSDVTILGDSQ